jgi:orotidine 5'-phosphate decarboxylase subfamily 2
VKINVAFFEAFGSAGWQALERLRGDVPQSHFLVLDAKRGDIGTTAERYAEALFDRLNADAVTLSPYLGADAIEPFLAHADRVVYVLARTSNPSAGDLQDLAVDGAALHERVATWVAKRWPDPRVGLVVGATAPDELRRLRTIVPGPAFLVPGVGAQGGDLAAAAAACDGSLAPGLVSISRGIAEASRGNDWAAAAASAATSWADRFREASATLRA